ncbi:MAG: VOC family protein [Chitinophagaceae bacterium]|nr:VOC family protein [Chitinophagaceae bacterium]
MRQFLARIAIVVDSYDRALEFYIMLGFTIVEDTELGPTKRWVVIAPPGAIETDCKILLAEAGNEQQRNSIGNQTGGRVFLFLYTDDFWRDYNRYTELGVEFLRPPALEVYGTVAVFKDIYGNLWDLIQPK